MQGVLPSPIQMPKKPVDAELLFLPDNFIEVKGL
jgi:hypothetical protein